MASAGNIDQEGAVDKTGRIQGSFTNELPSNKSAQ